MVALSLIDGPAADPYFRFGCSHRPPAIRTPDGSNIGQSTTECVAQKKVVQHKNAADGTVVLDCVLPENMDKP
jgi:hypothetical protein